MSDPSPSPLPSSSSSPSSARLRAEARKQKILSQGNDRLAKITGAMKKSHPPSSSDADPALAPEPPDVDISQLDSPPSRAPEKPKSAVSSSSATKSKKSAAAAKKSAKHASPAGAANSSQLVGRPANPAGMPPPDDPMMQMMRAMGLEMPAGGLPSDAMFGGPNGPMNPMMQQAFAGLSGMQPGAQQTTEKSWSDRIFPLLNLVVVAAVVLSAVLWWGPMSSYWVGQQGFPARREGDIDLKAEWEALHPSGPSSAPHQKLGPAPVFWMFVTIELVLQATRWMFNKTPSSPPGLLSTLICSLPNPYSTLATAGLRYYAIFGSLIDDLSVLVFGVGCAVVWLEWLNTPDMGIRTLVLPP